MGVHYSFNTKAKATLKLFNVFNSYVFEQEYGELRNCSIKEIETLRAALLVLRTIINKSK